MRKFRTPLVMLVVLMMLSSVVLADNVVIGDDLVTPITVLNFGEIDADSVVSKNVLLRIEREAAAQGQAPVFNNDAVVTITGSANSTALTVAGGSITLPSDWISKAFGTLSDSTTSIVTLTAPSTPGVYNAVITYSASGQRHSGTNLTREGTLNVTWTVKSVALPTYNLTMDVSPAGSGTSTDLTEAFSYEAGTVVAIQAVANPGYAFVNWNASAGTFGDANAASTTFTMPASDVTVTANFVPALSLPVVTEHPTNQEITYGQDATFTAAASGDPEPAVQWQVSTDGGTTWADISGGTNPDLILTAQTVAMSGNQYRAVFTNSQGSDESDPATLTVNPAQLTVTADNKTVTYGDATPDLTYQITGFVLGQLEADVVTGTPALNTAYVAGTPVSASPVTITAAIGTLEADNYSFAFSPGAITINRATLTVTAVNKTVTYGDNTPTLTYTITGFVLSEDASVVSGDPELSTAYETCTPVSASPMTITAAIGSLSAANYTFEFENGSLTINLRPITVKADDQTKIVGAADPVLTYQITSGSLADCDEFHGELTRDPGEDVGSYDITKGTLSIQRIVTADDTSANYDFTFIGGKLYIHYDFGGFLPPIDKVPGNVFKLRSTIPVKFQLLDVDGYPVSGAVASIYVVKYSNSIPPEEPADPEGESSGAANTGNLFRYDDDDEQYIFNLGTRKLTTGSYRIFVTLDDGTFKFVDIALK